MGVDANDDGGAGGDPTTDPDGGRQKPSRHEIEVIPGPADAAPDAPGVIRGVVVFDGDPPERKEIKKSVAGCEHEGPPQLKEDLVVTEGRVQYAYVYVNKGLGDAEYKAPKEPVYLDQIGCMYSPHVVSLQVGQELVVRNEDATLHNVNWPDGNKMQPAGSAPLKISYERDGVGLLYRCDIHPWMRAFICVAEHPFHQVTGVDGAFSMSGIPPGRYELVLWTEKYNKDRALPAVEVPPGGEVVVTFHVSETSGRRRGRGR